MAAMHDVVNIVIATKVHVIHSTYHACSSNDYEDCVITIYVHTFLQALHMC